MWQMQQFIIRNQEFIHWLLQLRRKSSSYFLYFDWITRTLLLLLHWQKYSKIELIIGSSLSKNQVPNWVVGRYWLVLNRLLESPFLYGDKWLPVCVSINLYYWFPFTIWKEVSSLLCKQLQGSTFEFHHNFGVSDAVGWFFPDLSFTRRVSILPFLN